CDLVDFSYRSDLIDSQGVKKRATSALRSRSLVTLVAAAVPGRRRSPACSTRPCCQTATPSVLYCSPEKRRSDNSPNDSSAGFITASRARHHYFIALFDHRTNEISMP